MQSGLNASPMHPFCRCSTAAHYTEEKDVAKNGDKVYNRGTDTSINLAEALLSTVSAKEPYITKILGSIVLENKGKLEGLDFRLKSASSLSRKIESDALVDNISLHAASKKIKDVLRYTTIFETEDFEISYNQMKKQLIKQGFEVQNVKNTWLTNGPYKGVNTFLKKDGLVFEMQYHTQESFDLKDGPLHELYERYRDVNTSDQERMKLFTEMVELSKQLKVPQNIERVK